MGFNKWKYWLNLNFDPSEGKPQIDPILEPEGQPDPSQPRNTINPLGQSQNWVEFGSTSGNAYNFIVIVLECAPVAYLLTTQCGAFLLRVLHAPCHTGVKANLKENLTIDPTTYISQEFYVTIKLQLVYGHHHNSFLIIHHS